MAETLSRELEQDVSPEQIRAWLYADLPEQQLLTSFDEPTPAALIERYNLSQAQGVLYLQEQARFANLPVAAEQDERGERRETDLQHPRALEQLVEDEARSLRPRLLDEGVE